MLLGYRKDLLVQGLEPLRLTFNKVRGDKVPHLDANKPVISEYDRWEVQYWGTVSRAAAKANKAIICAIPAYGKEGHIIGDLLYSVDNEHEANTLANMNYQTCFWETKEMFDYNDPPEKLKDTIAQWYLVPTENLPA